MANASLFSPANPHFFQPLLPGFQSHIKIPAKFFSKHIEGKHEGKTVNLISDASEKTWKVKMEGHRLTDGWKEFVEAHDLRMGDFVVFRHEGDMLFHVTALGPSCCEIQYSPSRSHDEDEESDEIGESSRKEKEIEDVKTESDQSASDLICFSISVTASNLSSGSVTVPVDFARRNGLNKRRQEIVLMNEEEKSWESEVRNSLYGQVFICQSWRSFCTASKLEVGDSCTFKLLRNAEKPVFRLCSRSKVERKKKIQSTEVNIVDKTGKDRFVMLTPTPNSLELGKQHLPVHFTRVNMLNKPREIILVDKDKLEWSMKLKADRGVMYIISGNGWKSFCAANEVVAGESLTLELIRGGTSPVLKFCSKMEQPPFDAEDRPHKRARVQRWSQETRPSRRTRASKKSSANQVNLQNTQPCSVSDKVAKVKQSVLDTLTSIRGFLAKLETMEQKLKDSLQEIDNLCMI